MPSYKLRQNNGVLLSQPVFIKIFGRSTAQFIQQLHYWIEKGEGVLKNDTRWIYNTAKEWANQLCLSSRQIERIIQKLKDLNIIKVDHFSKTNRVNFITLNYDALNKCFNELSDGDKMSLSDRQNVGIHIWNTKTTNKDKNYKSIKEEGRDSDKTIDSQNQVEHVKKNNIHKIKQDTTKMENDEGMMENSQDRKSLTSKSQNIINSQAQKPTTIQDMITIWNHYFPKAETKLSKDLAKLLGGAFKQKFGSDLTLWKNYCKRIESSSYLMGEGFKLSLYWALKFTTIDRILNGELGVKEIEVSVVEEDLVKKAVSHIESIDETPLCLDVRGKLLKVIGAASYLSWFTKVTFVEKGGVVNMKAETPFVEDYIRTHFGHLFNLRS
jgi:hypothetical protein